MLGGAGGGGGVGGPVGGGGRAPRGRGGGKGGGGMGTGEWWWLGHGAGLFAAPHGRGCASHIVPVSRACGRLRVAAAKSGVIRAVSPAVTSRRGGGGDK